MLRKIVEKGDPVLTKKCNPVTKFDLRLALIMDDMKETLKDSGGVGLAAPQIGLCRRMCVVMNEEEHIYEMINPEILETSGEQTGFEGCLSLPGKYGVVTRPNVVKVRAQDRHGNWYEAEEAGLTARCFCHEIAHLDGQMFDELCDRLYTAEELDAMSEEGEEE